MDKLKIIFLDFDGVISTPDFGMHFEPAKIEHLYNILEQTNAKIVITSSWAAGCQNVDQFINKVFPENNRDNIFVKSIYDIIDHVEYGEEKRGVEIERWLDKHEDEIDTYLILDDTTDMLDEQLFNFVQTDFYEGLTEREEKLSIAILNNKRIQKPVRLNWQLMYKWYDKYEGRPNNLDTLLTDYFYKTHSSNGK